MNEKTKERICENPRGTSVRYKSVLYPKQCDSQSLEYAEVIDKVKDIEKEDTFDHKSSITSNRPRATKQSLRCIGQIALNKTK